VSWVDTRLRFIAELNPSVRADLLVDLDREVSFLPMEAVGEDGSLDLSRSRAVGDVRNGFSYFEDGDVTIAKVTPCFENGKGALMRGLTDGAGFGTTELTVLRPRAGVSARFLRFFLSSAVFKADAVGAMTGAGGLKRVPDWFVRDYKVRWPKMAEQERIANFLDEQTTRIDALIADKERLVERLEDYRSLAIRQEVLGQTSRERNLVSGPASEPWIDMLPLHWGCPKVKYVFQTTSGSTPSTDKRELYYGGEIPWIRSLDLPNGLVARAEVFITEAALKDTACKLLPVDTILLAMYGGDGTIGKSGLLGMESACNQALCAILPNSAVNPRFLHWYMVFRRPYWMVGADGTRKDPNISQEVVREARVPMPPIQEQAEIADRLDVAIGQLDGLCRHVDEHIDRLREYRSSLISAAVSGQLDISTEREFPDGCR